MWCKVAKWIRSEDPINQVTKSGMHKLLPCYLASTRQYVIICSYFVSCLFSSWCDLCMLSVDLILYRPSAKIHSPFEFQVICIDIPVCILVGSITEVTNGIWSTTRHKWSYYLLLNTLEINRRYIQVELTQMEPVEISGKLKILI
jgi:hypothetical protein